MGPGSIAIGDRERGVIAITKLAMQSIEGKSDRELRWECCDLWWAVRMTGVINGGMSDRRFQSGDVAIVHSEKTMIGGLGGDLRSGDQGSEGSIGGQRNQSHRKFCDGPIGTYHIKVVIVT